MKFLNTAFFTATFVSDEPFAANNNGGSSPYEPPLTVCPLKFNVKTFCNNPIELPSAVISSVIFNIEPSDAFSASSLKFSQEVISAPLAGMIPSKKHKTAHDDNLANFFTTISITP